MKSLPIYVFAVLFFPITLFAQTDIFVHQACYQKNVAVVSHNNIAGIRVDSETLKFSVPKFNEPTCIVFSVDTMAYKIEKVWIDSATKRIDLRISNCKSYRSSVKNANLLTKEDRINGYYFDYLAYRFPDRKPYLEAFNAFIMDYVRKNSNSYLSLDYAARMTDVSDANLKEALDILEPTNGHYPTFQKLKNKLLYKNVVKINETIFDFSAKKLDGSNFSINDVNSKATVIMVWHGGCRFCKKAMPKVVDMQSKYAKDGLGMVYFSLDEDRASWQEMSTNYKIPNVNISDLQGFNGKIALQMGITATPYFIILDKTKKVRAIKIGDDTEELETELKKILQEK
jgi:thiol-disulfide isomerase/thioredoxin